MQNKNLDKQIFNFLSTPLKSDDHFTSAKLAILDTLGCIIEASTHDEVNNFAIEDKSFELFSNLKQYPIFYFLSLNQTF